MQRSGGLWGIVQQHGVALHGQLGISELTPCAQKRREAGRPVGADMAPDDPVLLRQLTRMICLSELTQQTACWCVSYICLLYTSPSPRDAHESRMPSSA